MFEKGRVEEAKKMGYDGEKIRKKGKVFFEEGKVEEGAEMGYVKAESKMAERCYFGKDGVEVDKKKGLEWAQKAANQGDALGYYILGCGYLDGVCGFPRDGKKAIENFKLAVENNLPKSWPVCQNIGELYRNILNLPGVAQNDKEAM